MFGDQCCYDTFQSTPPIRVATYTVPAAELRQLISIHATHTGGDGIRLRILVMQILISIHATHTGGDVCLYAKSDKDIYFNPRHPYGWRLWR